MLKRMHRTGITITAFLLFSVASLEVQAVENYEGEVIGECNTHQGVVYNVVARTTTANWYVAQLEYLFNPSQAPLVSVDADVKTRYFVVTPGNYNVEAVNATDQKLQGKYSVSAPNCKNGMTWGLLKSNPVTGTVRVGCGQMCDARKGDTPCDTKLPLLCIKKTGPGFPLPVPGSVDDTNRYNRWSGGIVGTTNALLPPATLAEADAICAGEFGQGWRVAEHHDGWGWAFQAYGGVGNPSSRFWVDINDTGGACWQ